VEYTEFESTSTSEIERRAEDGGGFDFLDRSFLPTASLSYGILEDWQAGLTIGYYKAVGAGDAEVEGGKVEIATFDPEGLTDLWLTTKYRVYRGPIGQFAGYGGVKFPVGKDEVINSAGERVEPSATAGSGAYDWMLGAAWSFWATKRFTLDVSGHYIWRGEHRDFQVGDRIDAGIAGAWRLREDAKVYPQPAIFTELLLRQLFKTEDDGHPDGNTGGTAMFVAPGFRVALSERFAFTASVPIPFWQDLNGEQLETRVKVLAGITINF
jgi:hypothetical protein